MTFYRKAIKFSLITMLTSSAFGMTACDRKPKTSDNSNLLGIVDGKNVALSDLSETEKNSFYKTQKQFYDATENLLSEHYFNEYLENYRKTHKLETIEQASNQFFEENAKVDKAEVDKFLKDNAELPQLKQIPENKRFEIVENYLKQMSRSKAVQAIVQAGLQDGKIVVKNVSKPVAPKFTFQAEGYKLFPKEQPAVTIVEFADYQCPYCVMAETEIKKTLEHYNGNNGVKVQFVYYDFPLSFHDRAVPASVAAYCASQQGQFWAMHDKIFARKPQDPLTAEVLTGYAESLKLDMTAFKKCQEDPKSVDAVNVQMAEGQRVGIQGTPSFFINGVRYEKSTSSNDLIKEIDSLM